MTSRQHSYLNQVRIYLKVAGRNFNQWKICFGTHVIKYINGWMLIMVILVQKRMKNLTGTMIQTHDPLKHGFLCWPAARSDLFLCHPTFGHFWVARTMGDLAAASIATVLVAVKHTQSQHILKEKTQTAYLSTLFYWGRLKSMTLFMKFVMSSRMGLENSIWVLHRL